MQVIVGIGAILTLILIVGIVILIGYIVFIVSAATATNSEGSNIIDASSTTAAAVTN